MEWLHEFFGVCKPIIGVCHIPPLPGDPQYDPSKGIRGVVERTGIDLNLLQAGGVDGIMFVNEGSRPYMLKSENITSASMSSIIGTLQPFISVPFGVCVLWDSKATVDVAVSTGAQFVRGVFTGVYGSDFGLWNTSYGEVIRHRNRLHGNNIRLLHVLPEAAGYVGKRKLESIIESSLFNAQPDALCVSGISAGHAPSGEKLRLVKQVAKSVPVLVNTGLSSENLTSLLSLADGGIVGTAFKRDADTWADVDPSRVDSFMRRVRDIRDQCI